MAPVPTNYTISIDMREPPSAGKAQIVFRGTEADRKVINSAAKRLGISTNRFMRTVVVQAAQAVLKEDKYNAKVADKIDKLIVSPELPPGMRR